MKYFHLIITLCYSFVIQAQIFEDFNDLELLNDPAWYGDLEDFAIANGVLHLDADSAGSSNIFLDFALDEMISMEWRFDLELDFSPSNNNKLKVILWSSDSLFGEVTNTSVYLKIGENGAEDAVELYLRQGSEETLILRGVDGLVSSAFSRHFIVQYQDATWKLYSRPSSNPYLFLEALDTMSFEFDTSAYFALDLQYTNSNVDAFHFDNIYAGPIDTDSIAPELDSLQVLNESEIALYFSESIDSSALNSMNYLLYPDLIEADQVQFNDLLQKSLLISFDLEFTAWQINYLTIDSIYDLNSNGTSIENVEFVYTPKYVAKYGDLRFSEIMPDPTPPVGLPEVEYIELYNNCDSTIDLEGYVLWNSGEENLLSSYELEADSFLLLCKESDVASLENYGQVMGIAGWDALVNSGDSLVLMNSSYQLIDLVYYSDSWFKDELKSEGGWSLERVNFSSKCLGRANWKESNSITGGSPGSENSVSSSEIVNKILFKQAYLLDGEHLIMEYEGELDSSLFSQTEIISTPETLFDWESYSMDENTIHLGFTPQLGENEERLLKLKNFYACQGDLLEDIEFTLAFTENADPGDVVINEFLFNAYTGAHDFLELYNNSDKYIDLKEWRVEERWEGIAVEDARLSNSTLILKPGEYFAFSENPMELSGLYPRTNNAKLIEVSDFPSFPDKEGEVVLISSSLQAMDSLKFSEEMHFSLLEDENGVSLERIHPDKKSSDPNSWISASESVGFATPGSKNSHYLSHVDHGEVVLYPRIISPNNDGIDDILQIHYSLQSPGWLGNVKVYSDEGQLIKDLVRAHWMEQKGSFIWDGLNENEERMGLGIYIVFIEIFNEKGENYIFKRPCIVE